MRVGKPEPTAWEPAPAVPGLERTPQCRRHGAGPTAHIEHGAVRVALYFDSAGVTRESPGSFRGNSRAVFELGHAGLDSLGKRLRFDVQHDLIALRPGARDRRFVPAEARREGPLGQEPHRVGSQLLGLRPLAVVLG